MISYLRKDWGKTKEELGKLYELSRIKRYGILLVTVASFFAGWVVKDYYDRETLKMPEVREVYQDKDTGNIITASSKTYRGNWRPHDNDLAWAVWFQNKNEGIIGLDLITKE